MALSNRNHQEVKVVLELRQSCQAGTVEKFCGVRKRAAL
jgi:hypothetical protein